MHKLRFIGKNVPSKNGNSVLIGSLKFLIGETSLSGLSGFDVLDG